jgi:hypothetical protein
LCDLFSVLFEDDDACLAFFLEKLSLPRPPQHLASLDKQVYDSAKIQAFHKRQVGELLYYLQNLLAPLQEGKTLLERGHFMQEARNSLGKDETIDQDFRDIDALNHEVASDMEGEHVIDADHDSRDASGTEATNAESVDFVEDLTQGASNRRKRTMDAIKVEKDSKTTKKRAPRGLVDAPKKSKNRLGQTARRK